MRTRLRLHPGAGLLSLLLLASGGSFAAESAAPSAHADADAAVAAAPAPAGATSSPAPAAAAAPAAPVSAGLPHAPALPTEVGEVPVLHQGRVKPLAVAAEECTFAIVGYGSYTQWEPGAAGQRSPRRIAPVALVVSWMLEPAAWIDQPILYTPFLELQKTFQLSRQWLSPTTLASGPGAGVVAEAVAKRQRAETTRERVDMTSLDSAAVSLASRAAEARSIFEGDAIALMPLAPDTEARAWVLQHLGPALGEAPADGDEAAWRTRLRAVMAAPSDDRDMRLREATIWLGVGDLLRDDPLLENADDARLKSAVGSARAWLAALRGGDAQAIHAAQLALVPALRTQGARQESPPYPAPSKIGAELLYTHLHPFTWVWLCYIVGGILAGIGLAGQRPGQAAPAGAGRRLAANLGLVLIAAGLAFNLYGLGTRVYITSLGAVTNLYETLVYVAGLSMVLGLVLWRVTGQGLYVIAAGVAGGICAMVGEALPPDLGSHIGQLQPVLRSKFWLWTHVKTVVASYAAFVLAWGMGNAVLIRAYATRTKVRADEAGAIYRCLQVGVVLIAAGTLLGAFWADYAWGRFWGWDPKEDCALLILLTYLVPLHLRHIGVVGTTGLAAWSVYGINAVVMSWYGVNFLLPGGKHAYVTGADGKDVAQVPVLMLSALQIVITSAMLLHMRARERAARRARGLATTPGTPGVGTAAPSLPAH